MSGTQLCPRSLRHGTTPAAILLSLVLLACSDKGLETTAEDPNPVLLLAIDGLEWEVILPLVQRQELPTLAALMEQGSFGLLTTSRPTYSPIIWTTVATGKSAPEHGIRGFVRKPQHEGEESRLYNSLDRKPKAFWNILSDFDRKVAVVGWWMTYPVEEVNGVMVAQVNTRRAQRSPGEVLKGSLRPGLDHQVHPPEKYDEILDLHAAVSEDSPRLIDEIFGTFSHPLTPLTEKHWNNTQWSFRSDATYAEIAGVLAEERFDLLAVYLGGADVVGHRFWRHFHPGQFKHPPPAEELADLGHVISDYYRYLDAVIASLLERLPDNTNTLVVSDHGMHAVNRGSDFSVERERRATNSGHHRSAWPGVFIAAGPDVREQEWPEGLATLDRKQLPTLASIFDVLPTLLTLQRIPVGDDMRGAVLTDVLVESFTDQVRAIATHDSEEWLAARSQERGDLLPADEERLEQLRALGYID